MTPEYCFYKTLSVAASGNILFLISISQWHTWKVPEWMSSDEDGPCVEIKVQAVENYKIMKLFI